MKASFYKRLLAYVIDTIILTLIIGVLSSVVSNKQYEKASEEYMRLQESYMKQEITITEYQNDIKPIVYDMQKSSVTINTVSVLLSIAYFIVFQYLNRGQTIGKKLMRIKITENNKEPSLKAMVIRTIIINSILTGILNIVLIYLLNKNTYYTGYQIVSYIELAFAFISALFIIYRKDKLGLHDIIAKTEVIEEAR